MFQNYIAHYFKFASFHTHFKQEVIAGATSFITMAYIIIVNPKILSAAGFPQDASMIATILSAAFGSLLMGLYANRPFCVAPYMGHNAFVAYTVVEVLGFSWQVALGGIFLGGLLFTILTLLNIRKILIESIPFCLKIAFSIGVGLFLIFIGLHETKIIHAGSDPISGPLTSLGTLNTPTVLLGILTFILMCMGLVCKIRPTLLISMFITTGLGLILGLLDMPKEWLTYPGSFNNMTGVGTFMVLDVVHAIRLDFLPVIFTIFILIFVDSVGTLTAMGQKANLLDANGNLPQIEKPMLCHALATLFAAILGTTTTGTHAESAAGIETGGRTGLTAVVAGILFLLALYLTPLLTLVPAYAYGPALVVVGMHMICSAKYLNFDDLTDMIPALTIITLMTFTYNLAVGMAAGFLMYPLLKMLSKKGKTSQLPRGLWIWIVLSLLFFICYPYPPSP